MSESELELNLIDALGRLKNIAFDKDFLGTKENIAPESVPEQYFAFHIGEFNFIVHSRFFCAVFIETPIAAVPNSPAALVGLSSIRGALTPIYQLHAALGYTQPKNQFIFCVGKADKAVGLLIDSLPTSLALSARERLANATVPENAMLQQLVKNFYFSGNKLWHLLEGRNIGEQLLAIAYLDKNQIFSGSNKAIKRESAIT